MSYLTAEKLKILPYYKKGLSLYKARRFEEAAEYFKRCLEIIPNDGPSSVYLERCEMYIKNPPPPDWDGVFVMKTK